MLIVITAIILSPFLFITTQQFKLTSEITNELVFNRFGPNAKLISARMSQFSNRTTGDLSKQHFLTITVKNQFGKEIEEIFFLKTAAKFDLSIQGFLIESKFYSKENPLFSKNIHIKPWFAQAYVANKNIIILENLENSGFKAKKENLDYEGLKSAIKTLARFHASSLVAESHSCKPVKSFYPSIFLRENYYNLESLSGPIAEIVYDIAGEITKELNYDTFLFNKSLELTLKKVLRQDNEINVLNHRDLTHGNFMFDDKGNSRLLDYQFVTYQSFGVDLTEFMYLNLDNKKRQKYEESLIKIYQSEIEKILIENHLKNKVISLNKVKQVYENKKICGMHKKIVDLLASLFLTKECYKGLSQNDLEFYSTHNQKELYVNCVMSNKVYKIVLKENFKNINDYMKLYSY